MNDTATMMQYDARKKSVGVAYLLWFFFGMLGVHRFYLQRSGSAIAILLMTLASFLLMVFAVGMITIIIPAIWVFIDLFLIPGMTRDYNSRLAGSLSAAHA